MKFVDSIKKEEYEKFVINHKTKSHFLQSYSWGEFSKDNKQTTPYYVGLINDKNKCLSHVVILSQDPAIPEMIVNKIYERYRKFFGRTTESQLNSWKNLQKRKKLCF